MERTNHIKKVCRVCKEEKPLHSFPRDKSRKWGRANHCNSCYQVYYRNHKEQIKKQHKQYDNENKEVVREQHKQYYRMHGCNQEYKSKKKYYDHKHQLKRKYNLSIEEYNTLFLIQEGRCYICERHQSECKTKFAVDHDHITGKVRGLLCNKCNLGLGSFNDSIKLLKKAILYLTKV